uniref:protein NATD1-like isoform X2 n=1 Tax=Monopterus albus TaxID=43700 RepID=UPI0009B39E32|nr:protein NATD1-like isoform X2 [Monopterus albus]
MALNISSRVTALTLRLRSNPVTFGTLSSSCRLKVEHDRQNQRFTVTPSSLARAQERAVLQYRFISEKEVDLMSTYVPETFRSQGCHGLPG